MSSNKEKIEECGYFEKDIMPGVDWYYAIPDTNFCVVVDDNDAISIAPQGNLTAHRRYDVASFSDLISLLNLLKLLS